MARASKKLTERQAAQAADERFISINLYLPPTLFQRLKKLSEREAVSISTLARTAVSKHYRKELAEVASLVEEGNYERSLA